LSLRTKASPHDLLKEGGEPLLLEALKGISLEIRLNLWKKLADVLLKLIESGDIDPSLLPILGGVSPLFLLRLNGNIDLTIDEYMTNKITENPLVEPILLDGNTLVQSMFGLDLLNEEEYLSWVAGNVPAPFDSIAKMLTKYLGNEVEVQVGSDLGGVKINLEGEGINLLGRAALLARFT